MPDPQGLPDVQNLAAFVQQDLEPQDKVQEPQPEKAAVAATPQQTETQTTPEVDWAQFKNKDGSLNHEALLKSYKEIQGAYTKTTQERKTLQEQFQQYQRQIQEQMELQRLASIQQPQLPAEDFDSKFIQDPKVAIEGVVKQQVQSGMLQAQIEGVLAEEASKDPENFQERYSYAMQMRNQFPYLTQSAMGVKKLFQIADQVRKDTMIKQSHRAVRMLFGDDVDMDKLRALAKKNPDSPLNQSLAYMPDTSSSSRTGAESGAPKGREAEIHESVAKGDVDAVIKNVFRQALER